MRPVSKLQFLTDNAVTAELACKGGVDWIQLRIKNVPYEQFRAEALKVKDVCKRYKATFIVNDSIKLALDIDADGVHVGKEDPLPEEDIKEMQARGGIFGCTTNTVDDILHFVGKPVHYLGLGPFRFTTTKQKLSPILGLDGYNYIVSTLREKNVTDIPLLVGIGGITEADVPGLMATGLHGVAISGAIANAGDVTDAAKRFKNFFSN